LARWLYKNDPLPDESDRLGTRDYVSVVLRVVLNQPGQMSGSRIVATLRYVSTMAATS